MTSSQVLVGKITRLKESTGAAEIKLSADEVQSLDRALSNMKMSEVFGGSKAVKK